MLSRSCSIAAAALTLLIVPASPRAEGDSAALDRRQIAGHAFIPTSTSIDAPVPVSSFGLETNLAYGTATGPFYDQDGNLVDSSRIYDVGGFGETIRFQFDVSRHLVLRGRVATSLVSGIDKESALVVGTTALAGGSLGAEWSTPLGQSARLGLSLDLERAPQLNLMVIAAVLQALHNHFVDSASALEMDEILTWKPGATASWVPTPSLGLTGRVVYSDSRLHTESYGDVDRKAISLGLGADLDLQKLWPTVPVSTNLALVDSIPLSNADSGVADVSLGVMYTGKRDVVAGLILGYQESRIRPQYPDTLRSHLTYLDVVIRIYWS